MSSDGDVTTLLRKWRSGDTGAFDALIPLVYDQLHKLAAQQMRSERPGHTLTPTGLLHESFLKLIRSESTPDWQDRKHFFIVASRAMRQLLVDYSRRRNAGKRSSGEQIDLLPDSLAARVNGASPVDVIDLDRALAALHAEDPRRAQLLELRYFGGLGLIEIAELTDSSIATVSRELRMTEAWLSRQMRKPG